MQHAVGNARKVPGGQSNAVRRVSADPRPSVEVLEPPVLDAQRPEERFDSEPVVWLAGHVLADKRGVVQGECRVSTGSTGIERQLRCPRVAAESKDILPRSLVWGAR